MAKFLEVAFSVNDRNKLIKYGSSIKKYLQDKQELYRSMFIYNEDALSYVKSTGSLAGFDGILDIDEIVIDIDTAPDINLKKTLKILQDAKIPQSAYQVWYSGRKGYHVHILASVWGFEPSPILPKQVSATVMKMFPFADSIYNTNRLIRFRNSYHSVSKNYKVLIPHEWLDGINIQDIDASSPKTYNSKEYMFDGQPILDIITPEKSPIKRTESGFNKSKTRRYTCISNIHENFFKRAENGLHTNHKELMVLVNHYKTIHGYSKTVLENILRPYYDYYESERGTKSLYSLIDESYRKDYNFGCSHGYLQPYCSSFCSLYSNKGMQTIENAEEQWFRIKANKDNYINLNGIFPLNPEYNIMPSEMIFVLGGPGTGKTLFVLDMIHKLGLPTLYVSSDSASHMIFQRALQTKLHLTESELFNMKASNPSVKLSNYISYLTIKDSRIDSKSIESLCKQMPEEPKIIVIDPTTSFDGFGKNEKEILDNAMDDIRSLANDHGYIFIIVSHLSRMDARNNEINMFSGYMSSRIEKNADKIIGLKRNIGNMENEGSQVIRVGHVKNRFGANLKMHSYNIDFNRQKIEFMDEQF